MRFGEAIVAATAQKKKITRDGWNGKDMFVYYQPGSLKAVEDLPKDMCEAIKMWLLKNASTPLIKIHGHFDMKDAQGHIVIGWLASQTDMLAEDWRVLE